MWRAGRRERRLTIQAVTETRTGSGAVTQTWADVITVSAELVEPRGFEGLEGGGQQARLERIFRILHREDVTAKHRVVYGGVAHDILSVREIGRRGGLELVTIAKVE